jgi:ribulose-phosphate 3-epimerase
MVEPVDSLIPLFAKAGANIITFHPEASRMWTARLQLIRDAGLQGGPGAQPGHARWSAGPRDGQARHGAADECEPRLWRAEVHPGTLPKLRRRGEDHAHVAAGGQPIWLEVDGGVKVDNIG